MKTLMYYLRIYFLITSQYIKIKMQFRLDFFISIFGIMLTNIGGIFTFWVIFQNISTLNGWDFHQLLFIYSISLITLCPLQIFFDNIWNLPNSLNNGDFIKYYFKPLNIMFYYMSEVIDIKGVSQLAFGLVALLYSYGELNLVWEFKTIVFLFILLFSSSLIMISLMILAASIGFWTVSSSSVLSFIFRFSEFSKYPMTIFNHGFQILFTFILPIGFIAFYPAQPFLYNNFESKHLFIPLVGFVAFIISYTVWKKGIKAYTGTGS